MLVLEPTLTRDDLILANDICKDPVSKDSHVLRFGVDTGFAGDTRSTPCSSLICKAGMMVVPDVQPFGWAWGCVL